jgi:hypothetical protein
MQGMQAWAIFFVGLIHPKDAKNAKSFNLISDYQFPCVENGFIAL